MKKSIYLYFLFFLSLTGSVFGQTPFVKLTNLVVNNNTLVADIGKDTSLIFFAENSSLGKLNKAGTISWYKNFQFPNVGFLPYDLMRISDTSFCAFGLYNSKGTSMIIKNNGALMYNKSYTLLSSLTRGVVMGPNRLLFLGINNTDFYLTKTDYAGTPILSKKYTKPDAYSITNNQSLVKLNPNLFIITLRGNIAPVYKSHIVTLAVDSSLNIIWSNIIGGDKDDLPVYGLAIGANCYMVSKTLTNGVGRNDMMVTCMDSLGNIVWNKTYGTSMNDELPIHASMDTDSTILISGTIADSLANESGFLAKINRNGDIIWAYKYNPPTGYKNMSIHKTFKLPSGLLRSTYNAKKISNSNVYAGMMDIKPSGNAACLSSYLQLTEKSIPLNPVNYPITTASVTPVASINTVTPINGANVLTSVCSNTCNAAANMIISSTRICAGNAVTFQNNSLNYSSINWLIDGTNMSSANSYTHVFNTPGIHSVSLVAFGTGCQDILTSEVVVDSFPVAAFSYTQQTMTGNFINLSSWNETDLWLLGDGLSSTATNQIHSFPGVGTYNNCLVAANSCGSDTVCKPFYAYDNSNFTFNSFYGNVTEQEWGTDVCQKPDGNLLVAARKIFSGSEVLVLEVGRSGNLIKHTVLNGGETGRIISMGSRGYCILSQLGSPANTGVITIRVPGTQLSRTFSATKFYCGYASKRGAIYAGGANSGSKAALIKMDSKFNKVWMKTMINCSAIYGVTELNDGTLLVVGRTGSYGGYLAKIDTLNGSMLWSKYYTTTNGMVSADVLYDSVSNHIYIAGTADNFSKSFIIKADLNGNIIWRKAFALTNDYLSANRCFLNQYGQLFLCYSTNNRLSLITCLDTAGNVKWTKNYAVGTNVQSFKTGGHTLCYDGGIAIAGIVSWGGTLDDVWVIKVDTSGINNTCFVTTVPVFETPLVFNLNNSVVDSTGAHASTYASTSLSTITGLYPDSTSCSGTSCSSYLNYSYNSNCLTYTFNFNPPPFPVTDLYWDFGDGTGTSATSPIHTFPGAGTYITRLSANIPGCGVMNFKDTIHVLTPPAPTGPAIQNFCNNGTVADLSATGTSIQWYAASTGGAALTATTTLIDGNHYHASQTISACESTTRFDVTAIISVPLAPTGITTQAFCNSGTVAELTATGTAVQWYAQSTGGIVLTPITILINGSHYFASQTIGNCESVTRLDITIVIDSLPAVTASADASTICTGNYVTLTGGGASTYIWSGGAINGVAFIPTGTFTYTVTGTDINGCTDTATKTITVDPLPVLVVTNPTVVCAPNTIDISSSAITIGSSSGTISYWEDSAATVSLNATYFTAIDTSGIYYIKLNSGLCFDIRPVTVAISNDCVWPGDANHDSIVNNFDLLPIGLYHSQTGSPRTSISNSWQAFQSTDWGTLQTNGSDVKQVDCNGNGIIDNNDTLAVNLNFSLIHAIVVNNYSDIRTGDPAIYFIIPFNSYNAGDWVNVEVWTGSSTIPVSNLYGIAFNINYDVSLVQPGTESLTYPNSTWLGTPGINAITIAKTDPLAETSYGCITRIDHINMNGFGKVADFKFQVNTNLQSPSTFHFSVSNYKANDATGLPIVFSPSDDSIVVYPLTTGLVSEGSIQEFTISPNPFSTQTAITFRKEQKHTHLKIMDVLGKEIKTITFTGKQLIIEKAEMQKGIYFIQLIDSNNNVVNRKIIVE